MPVVCAVWFHSWMVCSLNGSASEVWKCACVTDHRREGTVFNWTYISSVCMYQGRAWPCLVWEYACFQMRRQSSPGALQASTSWALLRGTCVCEFPDFLLNNYSRCEGSETSWKLRGFVTRGPANIGGWGVQRVPSWKLLPIAFGRTAGRRALCWRTHSSVLKPPLFIPLRLVWAWDVQPEVPCFTVSLTWQGHCLTLLCVVSVSVPVPGYAASSALHHGVCSLVLWLFDLDICHQRVCAWICGLKCSASWRL